ncbi:GTP-binding protein TypA [Candidatus Roizmanbacteria bacterium RIFOXYB2_FULL_41_10]|uniref:GTP-binding protein TypA n=1 Tax=Candidatus Roizmanbacteria bacterium RIFOXYA1_FULL_41_12 TaxID=1802082 RepID=A0A1F7KGU5_9BACT|nr:MAG: GTP-binding protein TypA [Candidatus Roizmanbacteria bacterium RIFOXYA1_FULL_41_12]OGK67590.1 MAG: GTP-binding protein TypA [Candidatus Roizmanbacteria bacterium RIFOXYB1_FULL_41_27]OGK71086.1 MAG: GTP-binding protein TypA [Candidatus Roizmanbacteria bacterium RIFOXYB2_FULL_41_10]OGK71678.1 MAG: GTP-binding protein TypA [Candidatus Roizmanbacteria bacterium RIFOXYC1_FULL_41_16]OGK75028.1 MAG: GTP-binding protein TypA [Candidatus Roizmanbacteria bacterium RIFOXYD1_FULL_41_24]OGK75218.1 
MNEIRNIAIIAHVDHGKTTLVDAMLKQTHTFRDNQKEMGQTLIMDSSSQERERGITILAKNTSVFYKDTKINIIDTPGHADFGGEVERTINMADGAILLVDAAEGPLPQTKFVLKKALERDLKIIVIINKIDKKDSRPQAVLSDVESLFLDLATEESSLEFVTLYAVGRHGKVFAELPEQYDENTPGDLSILFETILEEVPNAVQEPNEPFQMLVSTLDNDQYVGKLCIGKVRRGQLKQNSNLALVENDQLLGTYKAQKLYTYEGLKQVETEVITSGDIVAIAGVSKMTIGQTVCSPDKIESMPTIKVEEPTIKITIGANTSPFKGREGIYTTSRQIRERLLKEKQTNIGLKIEDEPSSNKLVVYGRGELHLSVLIENLRREGYEMEISRPQVIYKKIDGQTYEPYEEVTIEVDREYNGVVSEEMGKRKAVTLDIVDDPSRSTIRSVYKISSQNFLGSRNTLLTNTRGTAQINSYLLGYEPASVKIGAFRSGALVATDSGLTLTYGLVNAQQRGVLFVGSGIEIYEGMVVGIANQPNDIEVNVCKGKHLSNNRSKGEGTSIPLTPHTVLSLEQYLDLIADDEYLEVTPKNLRLRKHYLQKTERRVAKRSGR